MWRLLCTLLLAGATGCASITTGTSQSITIATLPEGASCSTYSNGKLVARVESTPGDVSVGKAATDLVVTCKNPGYRTNSGSVNSSYQAMTWGNIIFGGLIGVAIDAGTGSIYEYDPTITIRMIPDSFASALDRDAFFNGLIAQMQEQAGQVELRIRALCKTEKSCDNQLIAARHDTKRKLAEINAERLRARITQSSPYPEESDGPAGET